MTTHVVSLKLFRLPFDVAQGHEPVEWSFDLAHDHELVEWLAEPKA